MITERWAHRDYQWSLKLNQLSRHEPICALFRAISRIGDGLIWYGIILLLPFAFATAGLAASVALAIASLSGVALYKAIKLGFRRPRPYRQHRDIRATALALDEWSFPSGHTLHATAFAIILLDYLPVVGWLFLPFALLTAMSRVILGLHYPSDVVFGALIGAWLAKLGMVVSASIFAL